MFAFIADEPALIATLSCGHPTLADWSTDPKPAKGRHPLTSVIRIARLGWWLALLGVSRISHAASPERAPNEATSPATPLTHQQSGPERAPNEATSPATPLTHQQSGTERAPNEATSLTTPLSLRWSGTEHCHPEANLNEHLRRLLGKDFRIASNTALSVDAHISPVSGGLRLELRANGDTASPRALEVRSCEELAQAGALVLSVWLQERAVIAPAKPQALPENSTPTSPSLEAPAPEPASPDWVLSSRLRLEKTDFTVAPRRVVNLEVSGGPVLVFGVMPTIDWGMLGQLGLTVRRTHLQVGGLWLNEQSSWKTVPQKVGGRFSVLAGSVQLGQIFELSPRMTVEPALWSLLGRVQAEGLDTNTTTTSRGAWGATGLSGTLCLQGHRLSLGLHLAAGIPFGRPHFLVDETLIFQAPSVMGLAQLRLALRFS